MQLTRLQDALVHARAVLVYDIESAHRTAIAKLDGEHPARWASSCARVRSNRVRPFETLSDVEGRARWTTDEEGKGEGREERGGRAEGGGKGEEEGGGTSAARGSKGIQADAQVPLASVPTSFSSLRGF